MDVQAAAPKPLVMGRHLLDMGLAPGPQFSALLGACYEAQLDGIITTLDEGCALVKKLLQH